MRASRRAPDTGESANRAAICARDAGAALVESVALDCLCSHHLETRRPRDALEAVRRRSEVLQTLPLDASTGFQFNDFLLMASEVHLAAGNLALAAQYADTLAELACYREQDHLAVARRIKVDAMSGHLEAAVARGDRFLAAWERAGRPIARTLCTTTYAMAMVHGLLGDESSRRRWSDITSALIGDPAFLRDCSTGWAPTFDALVFLHRDQPDLAVERLSADIDDPDIWASPFSAPSLAAVVRGPLGRSSRPQQPPRHRHPTPTGHRRHQREPDRHHHPPSCP